MMHSNVVVNLIGRDHKTKNFSIHDANVKTTYRITKAARDLGVPRLIHMSSILASPDHESEWVRAKYESETIVRDLFPEATILRSCPIYGYEDRFFNKLGRSANDLPFIPLLDGGKQQLQPVWVSPFLLLRLLSSFALLQCHRRSGF
jgi:NADH dehydrogenase (ubiquinone) 1 alpha subcomplex subunit 9